MKFNADDSKERPLVLTVTGQFEGVGTFYLWLTLSFVWLLDLALTRPTPPFIFLLLIFLPSGFPV